MGGFAPFARIVGMCKDNQQDKEDQEFLDLAWEVSQLRKELELVQSFHNVAVRERDYERTLCVQYKKELFEEREKTKTETIVEWEEQDDN